MARRSDHTRPELEELIVSEGYRQMEEIGFARFSARELAKRIGYSVGTLYNVFGSYDRLMLAINARTVTLWAAYLREQLRDAGGDRIECLVRSYFAFAHSHQNSWAAIYDHRLPKGEAMPERYGAVIGDLIGIVVAEVADVLPDAKRSQANELARSLLATVHGHCMFTLTGTFALLGETSPQEAAISRVREGIAAASLP